MEYFIIKKNINTLDRHATSVQISYLYYTISKPAYASQINSPRKIYSLSFKIKCWNIRKKYICHADAAGHSGWHMDKLTGLN